MQCQFGFQILDKIRILAIRKRVLKGKNYHINHLNIEKIAKKLKENDSLLFR